MKVKRKEPIKWHISRMKRVIVLFGKMCEADCEYVLRCLRDRDCPETFRKIAAEGSIQERRRSA